MSRREVYYPVGLSFAAREQLDRAVFALLTCGHGHHFGVEVDFNTILTSELGVECINKVVE